LLGAPHLSAARRPKDLALLGLLGLMLVLPVAHALGTPGVGSFSMFTRTVRYRLRLAVEGPSGPPALVSLDALAPHLGRDARRVLLPARRFVLGETDAELLAGGLGDLARLLCRLRPDAVHAVVVLERQSLEGAALPSARARERCGRRP
jgi:hypothetical protein